MLDEYELSYAFTGTLHSHTQSEHVVTATVPSVWEHIHWMFAPLNTDCKNTPVVTFA